MPPRLGQNPAGAIKMVLNLENIRDECFFQIAIFKFETQQINLNQIKSDLINRWSLRRGR